MKITVKRSGLKTGSVGGRGGPIVHQAEYVPVPILGLGLHKDTGTQRVPGLLRPSPRLWGTVRVQV